MTKPTKVTVATPAAHSPTNQASRVFSEEAGGGPWKSSPALRR